MSIDWKKYDLACQRMDEERCAAWMWLQKHTSTELELSDITAWVKDGVTRVSIKHLHGPFFNLDQILHSIKIEREN